MSQQRQVVFSAREENMLSLLDRITRASDDLNKIVLSGSREQLKTIKQIIEQHEREISTLQKKADLQREISSTRESLRSSGGSQEESFQVSSLSLGTQQGGVSDLLRDLVEAVKETSQSQIENRTELFERSQLREGGSSLPSPGATGGSGRGGSSRGGRDFQMPTSLRGAGTMMAGAGAVGLLSLVAGAIGGLYNAEMNREESFSELSAISGESVSSINQFKAGGYFGRGGVGQRDRSTYGFSEEEFNQRISPTARSLGTTTNINDNILNTMSLERGTGMDFSLITQLNKLSRVLSTAGDSTDITQDVFKSMAGTGAFGSKDQDFSRLNDLMQTFVQFSEGQFMRSGEISTGAPFLNLRRRLEQTGEAKFKRDDYAGGTIESLNQGLYGEGSPEAQALKMDILRRANPDMGYFELQAEQEKGLGAKGLLEGVMEMVKGTGGTIDQQAILLDQMTGGSMRKSDILSLLKGDVDVSDIDEKVAGPSLDIEKRAEAATSDLRDSLESLKGEFGKFSQDLLFTMRNGVVTPISGIFQGIDEIKNLLK